MITDDDIKKMMKVFATRGEISDFFTSKEELKFELTKYATKEELLEFKNGTYDRLDKVIGEIKAMREEMSIQRYDLDEVKKEVEEIKKIPVIAHDLKKKN